MGNENNCCCISRPAEKKFTDPTKIQQENVQKVKKPVKTLKKVPKKLEKSIKDYYSPEIQDFISRINTKSTEKTILTKSFQLFTDDYQELASNLSATNSFVVDQSEIPVQDMKKEEVIYIDLPNYTLNSVGTLLETQQKEISWLLLQYEATDEEIDGYLPVKKQNRYKIKQPRWLLFTNLAIYVVMPNNFLVCRNRMKLVEIVNVYSTIDDKMFCLEVLSTEKQFFSFYSDRAQDALGAIQNLMYYLTNDVKKIIIVKSEKEILKKTEAAVKPLDHDLLFIKIKADYGYPGEKLIFTHEVYIKNNQNKKIINFLFMTNKTLYIIDASKTLFNFVENKQISNSTLIENTTEAIIHTEDGDLWLMSTNSWVIIDDIQKVLLESTGELINSETVELKEVSFKPLMRMKKSKQRKISIDLKVINDREMPAHNLNIIDDIIRAI